jgi:uncharacterized protein (TIGR02757 family)
MPMATTTTGSHRFVTEKQTESIKTVLDKLYAKYNHREFIKPDPLQFVYHYSRPADMEIAGLLAAELAYGRVQQIQKSLADLLGRMGASPFEFVLNFDKQKRRKLKNFKHRFTAGDDISDLLELLRKVLNQYGSIREFFIQGCNPGDKNIIAALSKFCDSLLDMYAKTHNRPVPGQLSYLLPRPAAGSACKRLNLFLRWMVRSDDVDTGLWRRIDKAKLIVPVDVHMGRLCRILGFHDRKIISLSTAVKITDCFAQIEPADPVKYDFALSRIGILDNCTGRRRSGCELCELFKFCFYK